MQKSKFKLFLKKANPENEVLKESVQKPINRYEMLQRRKLRLKEMEERRSGKNLPVNLILAALIMTFLINEEL